MVRVRSKKVARRGAMKSVTSVLKTSVVEERQEDLAVVEESKQNDEKPVDRDYETTVEVDGDEVVNDVEDKASEDHSIDEEKMDTMSNEENINGSPNENDTQASENDEEVCGASEERKENESTQEADVEEDSAHVHNQDKAEADEPLQEDNEVIEEDNEAVEEDNDDDLDMFQSTVKKPSKKESKKGVVYMSRVPPFMTPDRVRQMLRKYGDIERIYLVEEDKTHRKKRLKAGGNKKVNFTEGWIEFTRKSVAKRVAAALNTKPMGGKKRSMYYDDIWNLKYLKGFKWSHLTEKIAYENRVRDQKLRLEIAQAAKENAAFMERVEQSKQIDKMEERKKAEDVAVPAPLDNIRRTFRQHAPADKTKKASLGQNSKALLTKVFKKRKHEDTA